MSYRVEYGPGNPQSIRKGGHPSQAVLTALCFLVFCLLVQFFWPTGADILRHVLIPGDPAVTTAALEGFARDLGAGQSLTEAFRQFCMTILEGAGFGAA